ncbi:hypothetical protein Tco_0810630 [Tanacetum coccineum]
MFKDLKKFQAKLDRYHGVNYGSKVAIDCAKAKGDLMSYKMESEKSFNGYTQKINDLNQTISDMKKELLAHQETISIMSQDKEAQTKFHKTRDDKELENIIALENKIKVLDDIVYKTGQSVQTMNMLNRNCKTSFVKPEFLKKAQRSNPRMYDIGCYNDNLALMLAPEFDETIRLAQESRSKLSDLIRPFYYKNLNNLYDLFVPQREKLPEQRYYSEREYYYADHMNAILGVYTTLDEFTYLQCDYVDQVVKCERLEKELSKNNTTSKSFEALLKHAINLELALQQYLKAQLQHKGIAISELKKLIEKMKGKSVETKLKKSLVIRQPSAFKSQRQSGLGKPTIFSDSLVKTDFSKSKSITKNNVSNDFSKPVTAHILPQNMKSILKNTNVIAPGMYKVHTKPNQPRTPQFTQDIKKTNKRVSFSIGVIPTTSVSKPRLKSNRMEDRVMPNNSQGKKQEVEDHHRNFKFSNNKMSVTACNHSLNAKTSNVNFVCVTCGKCVLNDNHDMYILHYINGMNSRTRQSIAVPITHRDNSVHHRLWVLKVHDEKSQASKSVFQHSSRTHLSHPICLMAKGSSSQAWLWHHGENLDKMKEKGDACVFVGYSTQSRAYRVYNKRTRVIVEPIHVNFDELPQMASDHVSSDPVPQCLTTELEHANLSLGPQSQENVPHSVELVTTPNELDLLFSLMFDELLNVTTQVMSKSSAVTIADAPNQRQQQHTTSSTSTTAVTAKTNKEYAQDDEDEFINIFCTPGYKNVGETSSRYVDSSNMHTFINNILQNYPCYSSNILIYMLFHHSNVNSLSSGVFQESPWINP